MNQGKRDIFSVLSRILWVSRGRMKLGGDPAGPPSRGSANQAEKQRQLHAFCCVAASLGYRSIPRLAVPTPMRRGALHKAQICHCFSSNPDSHCVCPSRRTIVVRREDSNGHASCASMQKSAGLLAASQPVSPTILPKEPNKR
jgi:hypothetical protein